MKKLLPLSKPVVLFLVAGLCCLLWGSAFPFIKIGYNLFKIESVDSFSQILFAGIRFSLSGIFVIIIGSFLSKEFLVPKRKQTFKKALALSLFQTIFQYVFFYIGLAHTSGVKSSVFSGTNVFFALALSTMFFKTEKITPAKIIGSVLGFAGVVLINLSSSGIENGFALNGEGFIILSSISYAISSVLIKIFSREENTVLLSGWQFLFGGVVMIATGLLGGGTISFVNAKGIAVLIYLALISAVAYTLWGLLLKNNPVSKVAVFGFMTPVFGFLLSALFLGEYKWAFISHSLFSLLLVSAGIYIVNLNKNTDLKKN